MAASSTPPSVSIVQYSTRRLGHDRPPGAPQIWLNDFSTSMIIDNAAYSSTKPVTSAIQPVGRSCNAWFTRTTRSAMISSISACAMIGSGWPSPGGIPADRSISANASGIDVGSPS